MMRKKEKRNHPECDKPRAVVERRDNLRGPEEDTRSWETGAVSLIEWGQVRQALLSWSVKFSKEDLIVVPGRDALRERLSLAMATCSRTWPVTTDCSSLLSGRGSWQSSPVSRILDKWGVAYFIDKDQTNAQLITVSFSDHLSQTQIRFTKGK